MFDLLNGSTTLKTLALFAPLAAAALGVASLHAAASPADPAATAPIRTPDSGAALASDAGGSSSGAQAAGGAAKAANPEEAGVRAALDAYLQGHITGLPDGFRRAFQPDTRMLFMRDGKFSKVEIVDYIARAPGKPAEDEAKRRRAIDFIDIAGDAAIARITLDYPDVKFTDYMTLLKIDGEWRIVSKVFAADRRPAAERKSS